MKLLRFHINFIYTMEDKNMLNGRIGQVLGPFSAGVDLLDDNAPIGAFTPETSRPILYKLGIQSEEGVIVEINDVPIKIGRTGMYELDNIVEIRKLVFPDGADVDTIIDFVY